MAVTASLAVVALFVIGTATAAWAHHPVLSGESPCSDGAHVVTWTIGNSETDKVMHIDSATATINGQTFSVDGYSADVPDSGSTSATTTIPAGITGLVTLTVNASWLDGVKATDTTTVKLHSNCSPSTTTTTTWAPTTTTTTVPPTTTTTVAPTTTTTEAPTTTTTEAPTTTTTEAPTTTTTVVLPTTTTTEGPTTTTTEGPSTTTTVETSTTISGDTTTSTPITEQGSTVSTTTTTAPLTSTSASTNVTSAATTSSGALPFTGSSSSGPMIGLVSLGAGGMALVLARRKNQPRS